MEQQIPYTEPPPPFDPPPGPPSYQPEEPMNPWFTIWVAPRATMRQILDSDPRRMVHLLAAAGGAVQGLEGHIPEVLSELVPLSLLVGFKVTFGALFAVIALYIFSFLVRLTGGWIDGKGDFTAVRAALAWANIPTIWGLLTWIPIFIFLGTDAFNVNPASLLEEPGGMMLIIPLMIIGLVLGIWQLVIILKCIAEAHRFTAWHSLAAALLALMIFAVPIGLLAVLAAFALGSWMT